jgi:hypothetical protein
VTQSDNTEAEEGKMKSQRTVLFGLALLVAGILVTTGIFRNRPVQAFDLLQHKDEALKAYEDAQRKSAISVSPGTPPAPMKKPTTPAKPQPAPLQSGSGVRIAGEITSRWFVDYVPDHGGTVWNPVYVFAVKHTDTTTAAFVLPHKNVYCPRAVGDLTITAVSGVDGIIDFTTNSGDSGRFNMATQAWNFSS